MSKRVKYHLDPEGGFVIENYHSAKPFSSFFPGVAGIWGVPIWCFYVNRGQAVAGFGVKDKDHPIMEFYPANKAYQLAPALGFRTLIRLSRKGRNIFYDAFHNGANNADFEIDNRMIINSWRLKLIETNRSLGLETEIEYFTIPNDNYGGLARRVSLKNISRSAKSLEILDGLPQIIPFGMNNFFLKEMSRTIEAWMAVENLENNIPYLRLKVDPSDRPEVLHIADGNFYIAFDRKGLIKPIVDPETIFGVGGDFSYPRAFLEKERFAYPEFQLTNSKTPCAFAYQRPRLGPGQSYTLYSLIGNMDSLDKLKANSPRIADSGYFERKLTQNKDLLKELEDNVFTHSADKRFDFYCRQNFLDNLLRGGYPLSLGNTVIQVYSRKHGDLERDYNRFLLEPSYFSQGNGNYRDANQNRRSDIWFNPLLKEEAIFVFFNLLQADGYNPLVTKPDTFIFKGDFKALEKFFSPAEFVPIRKRLERPFSPGELILSIERSLCAGRKDWEKREEFLKAVLSSSQRLLNAEHGEGFWSDHWSYCLDLLEAYLGVYPENLEYILLEKKEFSFFDNSEAVRPRKDRYVLKQGKVFQYHSVVNNHTKANLIRKREDFPHTMRSGGGEGPVYKTNLAVKMLNVIANKYGCLDPFGAGIEMEANKPNWYDSLNGLPGLLGSSTCETFELKRWILFLKESLRGLSGDYTLNLPVELYDLLQGLRRVSLEVKDDYVFWDQSHNLREEYLTKTTMGFSGQEKPLVFKELGEMLDVFLHKIDAGLSKTYDPNLKLHYSYFINEVTEYEFLEQEGQGHIIRPLKFRQRPLPLFLEGPMHYLRVAGSQEKARGVFKGLRASQLYDKKLKMYKVTAPLEAMPFEIGRCRVFSPGWLENESVWLHMEYKYIYELLRNGLHKEFFEDFKNVLVPFQRPERYGRSILENSSFIASSAFCDKRLQGAGFVARLSGSTAEFISIWLFLCAGARPFYLDKDKRLCLEFKPVLPGWLFSRKAEGGFPKNSFAFKFLNKTMVVYHNPKRKDTFGPSGVRIKEIHIEPQEAEKTVLDSAVIPSELAQAVRERKIERIEVLLD